MSGSSVTDASTQPRVPLVLLLDGSVRLDREVVGNKGFGVDAMRRNGLPVPPAFAITTEACRSWQSDPDGLLDLIWPQVMEAMTWLESETGRTFGTPPQPLLVSVRSGAAQSMPGMMDTVLDLGINDSVETALAEASGRDFAADSRARFEQMYRKIVLGDDSGTVPTDPDEQLRGAIEAVFASWNSPRAIAYRKHSDLDDLAGTAVVIQAMVFGNMAAYSGTGVLFSRNPITGASEPFGEWLLGGQGEDVVSGTNDCDPISVLADTLPGVHDELMRAAKVLEGLATDVQDIEFTVENGKLWLLQTRNAKRSAAAAVRFALTLHEEGMIDSAQVIERVLPAHIDTLLLPSLQPETRLAARLLATGLPACPGVVVGRAVTDPNEAIDAADEGEKVILVRSSTSPDDVHGMLAAEGIVTELGGATSHAAVVSREIGRPAVVGCGPGVVDSIAGKIITVDGNHGEIREGTLELTAWSESDTPDFVRLQEIVDARSPLRVHPAGTESVEHLPEVNADTIRAALASGTTEISCEHPLLAALIAARLTATT
ncbi:pyruvate, phosphate dikinase [Williamsia sp. R60]